MFTRHNGINYTGFGENSGVIVSNAQQHGGKTQAFYSESEINEILGEFRMRFGGVSEHRIYTNNGMGLYDYVMGEIVLIDESDKTLIVLRFFDFLQLIGHIKVDCISQPISDARFLNV